MNFIRRPVYLVTFIVFLMISNLYAGIHAVTTKLNSEVDPNLQKDVSEVQEALFDGIKTKNYNSISNLISPKISGLKNFDLKSFVDKVSPLLNQNEFVISDQYYSKIKSLDREAKATIVPSLSDKNKFIINNHTFYGKESYNLFLKSTNLGWQYLSFLSMSKFSGKWKINIIHFGNYAINYLSAPKLFDLGMEAKNENRISSCVVYAWAMNRCLRPAPYLQYMDEKKYIKFIKSSFSEMNSNFKFPFYIEETPIIGFQVETTEKEGLIPIVLYLTDLDLKNPDVEKKARRIKEKVLTKFYGLDRDFDYLLMRGYNEMPTDPQKRYNIHGTIIKLRK